MQSGGTGREQGYFTRAFLTGDQESSLRDPTADETVGIKLNAKKGRYEITVNIKEAELTDPDAGNLATGVVIGQRRWLNQQTWTVKAKGKKLQTP